MVGNGGFESLESLLEFAPGPALIADDRNRIVVANPSAETLFGYQDHELVGRELGEILPTLRSDPNSAQALAHETILGRHRDGTAIRLSAVIRPVPTDQQVLTAAYLRPSLAEEADPELIRSVEKLPIPLFRFDSDGRLVSANTAAGIAFGTAVGHLIGKTVAEFGLSPTAEQTWRDAMADAGRSGGAKRFGFAMEPGRVVANRWFSGSAIADDAGGGVVVVLQDVSALHRVRTELEAAEYRFRSLTESSQDLISQHRPNGTFLYASPAASQLLHQPADTLVGASLAELVVPEDRARVGTALARASEGRNEPLITFRLKRTDGTIAWCEMMARGNAEAVEPFVTCITRDISERVRGEEVLRAASRMEATATLAAGVAHDFNNLMTSILGNAELLLTDPSFPDIRSRLTQVADAAKRGGALAQQLLAYARGGKYQTEAVDVNEVVRQTLHLQKHYLPPRIQLEVRLDPAAPPIEADPIQIGQVVTNLCINAAEAIAGMGRITITVRTQHLTPADETRMPGIQPGLATVIEVADTGTGIDPATLNRVFEPFFSTKFQGRGLGLAAVYGIVKNHRGYIGVESTVGRGTTFRIFFPSVKATAAARQALPEAFPSGRETILLVDDDEGVVDVTKSILEHLGYQVLVARHGIEAVEIARAYREPIDLAIVDLGMPLAGGAEALPFLRMARPTMRILISTGYEMNEVVQGLLAAGADGFLQKPYRVSGLATAIRQVLERPEKTEGPVATPRGESAASESRDSRSP